MTMTFEEIINRGNYVILDTETTGLKRPAEICEISIIDPYGKDLLNTLVKTVLPIPDQAIRIHGIDNEMVENSPSWIDVRLKMLDIIQHKDVIIYNAIYDRHMMHCSDDAHHLQPYEYKSVATFHCAMLWYADLRGEWDDYHKNNRWHKLTDACEYEGINESSVAHRAIGDCLLTAMLIQAAMERKADEKKLPF